ncbi:MAG TPA: hypothetical protein VGD61_09390 [Pyrinomonadaceae bacterium]
MKNVNCVFSYREQYAIAAHDHLTNLFLELVVFGCKRKAFGYETELPGNGCP